MSESCKPPSDVRQKGERAFWLDVLRVLLCTGVVVYHYTPDRPSSGPMCVDGFFVLSGFLLAGGFARMQRRSGMNVCTFYQNKLKRLLPTLTVSLFLGFLCTLATHLASHGATPLFRSWQGSDFRLADFLGYYNAPSWYMVSELSFLTLAPFFYFVYDRGKGWMYALSAATAAFAAFLYARVPFASIFGQGLYFEPQARLWQFTAGLCAWNIFADVRLNGWKKPISYALFALTAILLAVLAVVKQHGTLHLLNYTFAFDMIMVLLFMVVIPTSAKFGAPRRARLRVLFTYLAALTYPVFLYHSVSYRAVALFSPICLHRCLPDVAQALVSACATLVLSVLSLHYLDGFFAKQDGIRLEKKPV